MFKTQIPPPRPSTKETENIGFTDNFQPVSPALMAALCPKAATMSKNFFVQHKLPKEKLPLQVFRQLTEWQFFNNFFPANFPHFSDGLRYQSSPPSISIPKRAKEVHTRGLPSKDFFFFMAPDFQQIALVCIQHRPLWGVVI